MKHFIGKVCTVITVATSFRKEESMLPYFVGVVDEINNDGIWLTNPNTGSKSFISRQYLISISEEQILFEDNPEHAKIIQEYRKAKPEMAEKFKVAPQVLNKEQPITPPTGSILSVKINNNSPFLDTNAMADLSKKAKQIYGEKNEKNRS